MPPISTLRARLSGTGDDRSACGCDPSEESGTLRVDATDCEGGGRLASRPDCRETVVTALTDHDVDAVHVTAAGIERRYDGVASALLVAAGRFVDIVREHDERLAALACRDPLAGAREATGRADAVSDVAAETGLAEVVAATEGYESALAPVVGLQMSRWRVDATPPHGARLVDVRDLSTGATVRQYRREDGRDRYVLEPLEHTLDAAATEALATAYDVLADGTVGDGDRAPSRAVRDVAPPDVDTDRVARILRKHTHGYGLLADLFADTGVSDVFVTAPAPDNPLRVRIDDETVPTNVRLTTGGVDALASRFRRESGAGFSRADPTLDTAVRIGGRQVRVAGVTAPASDGTAFAFRAHDEDVWTLPALVANDTLTAAAGALLSLAVERGRSLLVAGPRGAGKTTLLGALLWEIPPAVRTVVIEDTPELPVGPLQNDGRDVQQLRTGGEDAQLDPAGALRTALRLGNGALVVGEVRGAEARVLYEAMRVGANSEAVLGTIHGDGAAATYERVVSDLGVAPSSFGATDLVVTLEVAETADQPRRVRAIEEVTGGDDPAFDSLYDRQSGRLDSTGRVERGNSRLAAALARPTESYARVRETLATRRDRLEQKANRGRATPGAETITGVETVGEHNR
jgi:flagellar protein FlaI